MSGHPPSFVTFTGVDDVSLIKGMRELSQRYPIEWGVLIDLDKTTNPLFPDAEQIDRIRRSGLRLAAHVCGELAQDIAAGKPSRLDFGGFCRVQVNHGRSGATRAVVENVSRMASRLGVRGVLQCDGEFPETAAGVDWLYDVSFGEGVTPATYPAIRRALPFCGISGGIRPDTVRRLIDSRLSLAAGVPYWLDMESGVRTDGRMNLAKCEAVCRAVFSEVTGKRSLND